MFSLACVCSQWWMCIPGPMSLLGAGIPGGAVVGIPGGWNTWVGIPGVGVYQEVAILGGLIYQLWGMPERGTGGVYSRKWVYQGTGILYMKGTPMGRYIPTPGRHIS